MDITLLILTCFKGNGKVLYMNGIINVYKEKGYTSHDVVAKLRGILRQKKIGHTGTLDPEAVGVLPVCLGNATKVCDLLTEKDKVYRTVVKLGVVTDTQDMTGTVLNHKEVIVTQQQIEETVQSFLGEYHQIPPMYSALKVNGKKLYELAREGKVIERKPRLVKLYQLNILEMDLENKEISLEVECSKGTYIRTLCHDIGEKLGCGAAMKELIRTRVSCFDIEESVTLAQIEQYREDNQLHKVITEVDKMFEDRTKLVVKENADKFLYNGNILQKHQFVQEPKNTTDIVRVYDSKHQFAAIYQFDPQRKKYKPVKMFL